MSDNAELEHKVSSLENKIDILEDRIAKMEVKIDTLAKSVEDLVLAWSTAKGITAFVKWSASIATACGIIWAFLHNKT